MLGQSDLVMSTERVDDVALLIGQRGTLGCPEVLERPRPCHWTQRGRSWGWTAVIWLASLVTAGDHRQGSRATSITGLHHTLSPRRAQRIEPRAGSEDRLSPLLTPLSQPAYGHAIARDLQARSMAMHDWAQHVLRCDATTGLGAHAVSAGGVGPFGQRNDAPPRPHSQVMRGALAPLGRPLVTDGWSGERADDGFDLPLIERMRRGLPKTGLRLVGDGKMSAVDPRAYLARPQAWDVSPWPLTGATAAAMDAWSTAGVTKREAGE